MSKPIINGIDVSECEYINCCSKKAKCIILQDDILSDSQYCESELHCYFKQLKRLQKENEKLKEVTNEAVIEHENLLINRNEFAERANKYRQALEEIRSYCDEQNLKADYTACYITNRIDEVLNDRD